MDVVAYDFETTGVNPKQCEPCQLAWVKAKVNEDGSYSVTSSRARYLKIDGPMPVQAFNVHSISKEMCEDGECPVAEIEEMMVAGKRLLGYNNRAYDDVIARRYGAVTSGSIDLFEGARRLHSKGLVERATLGVVYRCLTGNAASNAHDALADVYMTLDLIAPMMKCFEIPSFRELVGWLVTPQGSTTMKMPFGKHRGRRLCDLPISYVRWAKENLQLSGDLKAGFDLL